MDVDARMAEVAAQLESHLIARDIRAGFALLDEFGIVGLRIDPNRQESISLLFSLAQWVDLGFRDTDYLRIQLARLDVVDRSRLALVDFLTLRLIDAFLLLAERSFREAQSLLEVILRTGEGLMPDYLTFVAHFWQGRVQRQYGSFDEALLHIRAAQQRAHDMQATRLVAVTKIHESWLVFHRGERSYALQLLDEAEAELLPTGHALSLGNIAAARGRFVRSSGDYAAALLHFESAVRLYSADYANHPNNARALVNAAYVKRLMALELQPEIKGGPASAATHAMSLEITRQALELLGTAARIYTLHQHQGGTGSVLVHMGHLQLESGEIERAAQIARDAYTLGANKQDRVLMARARILQAFVELAYSEEQLETAASGGAKPAQVAVDYAEDAIALALVTQNKRLQAAAYITRGLAATDDLHRDWEVAKDYAAKGAALLGADDRDHLSRELKALKVRITRSSAVNDTLRRWSEGDLGNKTFQQIEEEFAEIVIPRVWTNLGRNVTRVARQLSISPKKVRRVLRRARYVD